MKLRRAFVLALSLLATVALPLREARAQAIANPPEPAAPPSAEPPTAPIIPEPVAKGPPPADPPSATPAAPPPADAAQPSAPFAWGDFTWMNGQSRQQDFPLKAFGGAVTLSLYMDVNYAFSLNHPRDNTFTGTASVPRHNEFNINLASVGLEWNYRNVLGRFSLQYGSMISIVQDLDGTTARGRNMAVENLRYIREGTVGYHFDVAHGLNLEGGIFMSYIGLESFLLAENWNYTRSVACEHTPFYFQGMRLQYFPTDRLKIEPWLMNGWQTYGKWNAAPAGGTQVRWSPVEALTLVSNFYVGTDTQGTADRIRFHNDHSAILRYHDAPARSFVSKAALSLNNHVGFETGGHDATGAALPGPANAHMLGSALAHRLWFLRNRLALAVRGEVFSNPSRYLSQYPPPGFETGPGVKALQVWALTGTFDVMPTDFMALRFEASYRKANVPYYAGPGGTTSPSGYQPTPVGYVPDIQKDQTLFVVAANFRL